MPFFCLPGDEVATEIDRLRLAVRAGDRLGSAFGDPGWLSIGIPEEARGLFRCGAEVDPAGPDPWGCGAWGAAERLVPCPRCGSNSEPVALDEAEVPAGGLLLGGDPLPAVEDEHDAKIARAQALLDAARAEKESAIAAKAARERS